MTEEKKCDCKEKAIKKVKEFLFISGSVFVGATLAILVSASLLKPKCPPPPMGMMPPRPGIERQMPPRMGYGQDAPQFRKHRCHCKCHKKHNDKFANKGNDFRPDFSGQKQDFPPRKKPTK